jgi:DNA-binding transcriptional MocR family regulator
MASQGWLLAPGSLFHSSPGASTLMRLNFASTHDSKFWQAFAQAQKALQRNKPA